MYNTKSLENSRLLVEWALLLIAAIGFILVAQNRSLTERFDLWALDFATQGIATETDPDIAIVEIDERSLATLGVWPWGREIHAQLIQNLAAADPAVIGYDVLFVEPSNAEADAQLGQAIAQAGNVVLAHAFVDPPDLGAGAAPPAEPVYPIDPVVSGAAATGHVAIEIDSDGAARRFDLTRIESGESFAHFAQSIIKLGASDKIDVAALPKNAIIPYGPPSRFVTEAASEIVDNTFIADKFKGKIVLIGATAQGLGDQYSVPASAGGLMSGVEMQANLLSAILQDRLITPAPIIWSTAIQLLAIIILFLVFWRLTPRAGLIAAASLIAVLMLCSLLALRVGFLWFAAGPAITAIAMAYPLWAWRRLASVSRFLESEAAALRSATDNPDHRVGEGFDFVARQVSRVKMLTGEVRSNLRLVQDVISASPDAMLVADAAGKTVMANEAARRLFGEECAAIGSSFVELFASANAQFDDQRGELLFEDQSCFLLAKASIDPSVGSEMMVLRDITGIKADERQRRETLEFLSHDMRSPQVAIIGLAGQSGATLDEGDRLGRIESQARRTLKLTDDFVQIARISTEGIHREEVELNSVLSETADRAFPLAHRKQISIVTHESEEPMFVELDPVAIARMLDNLVGNAIKFAPEDSDVTLSLDTSGDDVFVISVRDQGPGLPPERVANPFARFGAKSSGAGPSAGLGLAFVKQVVEKHGGTIEIETAAGEGTEFRLSLPYS